MKQTIEIEVPEGKKAVWKNNTIVFEGINQELPKTWTEFCKKYPIKKEECVISLGSRIVSYFTASQYETASAVIKRRINDSDANLLPNKEAAKAHLALIKLHQLRDCYRQGWKPDWKSTKTDKYCIINCECLYITSYTTYVRFLSFQSIEIARQFLDNFRDLIEEAGDLI